MSSLIGMAVYDTVENKRSLMTKETLSSINNTVNLNKHRLIVVDNGSCEETKAIFAAAKEVMDFELITNPTNVGTAKAINQAWRLREKGEHVIKMDNDVVIYQSGWADLLEEAISRQPKIGIIGLKRKDLAENPNLQIGDHYKSNLMMLPQERGQKWIVVEEVKHVMGTCQMYNYALIDKIGGLYQMEGIYGFDDSLASIRCSMAGFMNVFLPSVDIDHIDDGGTDYTEWKKKYAGQHMELFAKIKAEYISGDRDIFYPLI